MSAERSHNLDPEIRSTYTILPMTVDCHKLFLTIDKMREDEAAKRVVAQAAITYPPVQQDMNALYPQQLQNQQWDMAYIPPPLDQLNPGGCLFQPGVPPPGTWDFTQPDAYFQPALAGLDPNLLFDGAPLQTYGYPSDPVAAPQQPSPGHSHASASISNNPRQPPRCSSVTPPHVKNGAAPLFPDGANQWSAPAPTPAQPGIKLPTMPPVAPPQRAQTSKGPKKKVNPQRPGFMDVFLNSRQQPDVRISRQPAPQPVAGPSRLAAPLPYPYGTGPLAMLPSGYVYGPPAPAPMVPRETGRAKTMRKNERSAPYTKRQPPAPAQHRVAPPQLPSVTPQHCAPLPLPPQQRPPPIPQHLCAPPQLPPSPPQQSVAAQQPAAPPQQAAAQPTVVSPPATSQLDLSSPTFGMPSAAEAFNTVHGLPGDWGYDLLDTQTFSPPPQVLCPLSPHLNDLFESIIDLSEAT
ncbi:hypothetical protein AURDEDRAFT_171832 [Auricularia subglabra TFB-10046 SS5]|uniref:Uncharacterized protein n=1 Tax=Auricularia subglabra (strain TFB-10046 / SS5) TaxID=717982 RepID=J0WX20_AURST|nr:hypothetical protein AURDEDRAFT_171832 [Auricularia subglabra TFB-10046 SS5]